VENLTGSVLLIDFSLLGTVGLDGGVDIFLFFFEAGLTLLGVVAQTLTGDTDFLGEQGILTLAGESGILRGEEGGMTGGAVTAAGVVDETADVDGLDSRTLSMSFISA